MESYARSFKSRRLRFFFGKSSLAHLFYCFPSPPPGIRCVLNKTIFLSLLVVSTRTALNTPRRAYLMTASLRESSWKRTTKMHLKNTEEVSHISAHSMLRESLSAKPLASHPFQPNIPHANNPTPPPKILFKQKLIPCPLLKTHSNACALGESLTSLELSVLITWRAMAEEARGETSRHCAW